MDGGSGGFTLSATSDPLIVETRTDAVAGEFAASDAGGTRLRLGLEDRVPIALGSGSVLMLSMEIGLRHDGGDAET